jgi:uncharacterized membrane protein
MKKLEKSIFVNLPPVKLFLEDIEAIEEIYKENCETFEIRTDSYILNSSEELRNLGQEKLNYLYFGSWNPYITLEIEGNSVHIYSGRDDAISIGIVNKIKSILDRRINFLSYFANSWILIIILNSINLFLFWLNHTNSKVWVSNTELVNSLIIMFCVFFASTKKSVAYLENSKSKNFFTINRNQFFLLISGGIITFIVQILVQVIIQLWIKQKMFNGV